MRPDQEARAIAKEKNFYLWNLVLDGKVRQPPTGRFQITGPLPPEYHGELLALVERWSEEGKI
jgi:hypothetical protein